MKGEFLQKNTERFDNKALDAFVNDLEQYDKEHSEGTWFGRSMGTALLEGMSDKTINEEGEIKMDEGLEKLQKEIQKNLTIDDLENRYNPTLNKLGLNLESPNKLGNFDENEIYALGSIKINIENKEKYLSFLKSLEQEKLSGTQKKILKMTVEKISDQIQNEYNLEEADERLLELFSGVREIVAEYERLGMSKEVAQFKDYIEYANSGYFREYILAKNRGIFKPVGEGWSLSTYQEDSSYDNYVSRWEREVFDTLDKVRKNPNAKEFYNKILQYAKECIAFSENDPKLEKYEKRGTSGDVKYVTSVRKGIAEVKKKLFQIAEL